MKSPRGFLAAIVFLLALPTAVLSQMFFENLGETILHFAFAAGFALISIAVFDFFKPPKWIILTGSASTGILAVIFLLQGMSDLLKNDSLNYLAFQVLGQRPEAWLIHLFHFWCVAILLIESRGKTKILGLAIMAMIFCLEIYSYGLSYLGTSLDAAASALKLLYLLPFVWFLFESRKRISAEIIEGK